MLLAVHMKDPPDPGDLFPSLRRGRKSEPDADDAAIFQQVSASLMPYSK